MEMNEKVKQRERDREMFRLKFATIFVNLIVSERERERERERDDALFRKREKESLKWFVCASLARILSLQFG